MPRFKYKAIDVAKGETQTGYLEADNEDGVRRLLQKRKLQAISIKRDWKSIEIGERKVDPRDLIIMTRQLSAMLDSGLPLSRTLHILHEQTASTTLKRLVRQVILDVESGESLSTAFRQHPKTFGPLFVSMVMAGETSGRMGEALTRVADFMESSQEINEKVKSAFYYPIAVIIIATIGVLAMYYYVIPNFEELFKGLEDLPLITRFNLFMSNFCREHPWVVAGVIIGTVVGARVMINNPITKAIIDKWGLRAPIFGPIIQKAAIARFARTMSSLHQSGVHLLDAMHLTAQTTGNSVIQASLEKCRRQVGAGANISDSLRQTGVFPPMVISMISVGEETGELTKMLDKIGEFYEADVKRATERGLELLKPILLVFMGLTIGSILYSIYSPMFDTITAIQY